nr:hypothetical protein [Tanacetum cinerariifolium]
MDSTNANGSGKEFNDGRKSFVEAISESLIVNDSELECIPADFDENGVEVVVFNERMWSRFGFKDIVDYNNGVFFMKFYNEKGLNNVVNSGPWMVNRKPLVV